MPLLLPRLECDDDLFPSMQVFHLDHAVRISGLQKLRALQSDVLPVAIGTRNTVTDNSNCALWITLIALQSSSASRFTAGASGFASRVPWTVVRMQHPN